MDGLDMKEVPINLHEGPDIGGPRNCKVLFVHDGAAKFCIDCSYNVKVIWPWHARRSVYFSVGTQLRDRFPLAEFWPLET